MLLIFRIPLGSVHIYFDDEVVVNDYDDDDDDTERQTLIQTFMVRTWEKNAITPCVYL